MEDEKMRIALIAHDKKKEEMIQFYKFIDIRVDL